MAFRHGKNGVFKIGTLAAPTVVTDISTYCEEVSLPRKIDTAETTTFGAGAKTYVVGYPDATIAIKGKWDLALDSILAAVVGFDTALAFEHGPEGAIATRVKYTGFAFLTDYQVTTPVGDVVSFTASLQVTGPVVRALYP
jgi:hypothetical protein